MKTKTLLLFLLLVLPNALVWGQRSLSFNDVTTELNVFSGADDEAGLVFSCATQIPLKFESSHDKEVDIYQTEIKGDNTVYYIRLKVGRRYQGRKVTVVAPNFMPLVFEVDLQPKALKQYYIFDPDAAFVYGCYYEYRKRGTDFFQKSMYAEAKEQYSTAKGCSDCPVDSDLADRIADIDSILSYVQKADQYTAILDFKQAADYYRQVLRLNPQDQAIQAKRIESELHYSTDCKRYSDSAESYYQSGDFEKALELYEKVVALNCFDAIIASEQIKIIKKKLDNRKQRATVLTYELGTKTPIGFSIGSYKTRRFGGYFSLAFHPDVFHAMRKDYKATKNLEADISFGWSTAFVSTVPVWIFFGPGYTCRGEFVQKTTNSTKATSSTGSTDDDMKFKLYSAISPELGVLGKWKMFALRYTFQYRFALSKDYEDKFSKTRHSFGIGFCF